MLLRHYQIFQLTLGIAESGDEKSLQLTAVFNDPEMAFRCSRFKYFLISFFGPVHKFGILTFECNDRRDICWRGEAERRG